MALRIEAVDAALGARVYGVDLSEPLAPEALAAIRAAYRDRLVLVFPDQRLSEDAQLDFARLFGPLQARTRPPAALAEGGRISHPGTMLVSNIREDGRPIGSLPDGEMQFHSDGCYVETPLGDTFLYAIEIPSAGGDTQFVDMRAAYDALPSPLRRRIAGRVALHAYSPGVTLRDADADYREWRQHAHPVVRLHAASGRPALYVNRLMTRRIEGLDEEESGAVLAELFDHVEQPRFRYSHRWRVGDLVMWDNRATLHARTDFDPAERRLLRRVATAGERPVGFVPNAAQALP